MSLPCQGWMQPPGRQGCAGGSSGSSSWMPAASSSLCSSRAEPQPWHCCAPPKCCIRASHGHPWNQVVAVPWQGPLRSPTRVLALHAPMAPPSPRARQSIIPPARLPSGSSAGSSPSPRPAPGQDAAGDGARTAGTGQRCRHSLNQGTLCT